MEVMINPATIQHPCDGSLIRQKLQSAKRGLCSITTAFGLSADLLDRVPGAGEWLRSPVHLPVVADLLIGVGTVAEVLGVPFFLTDAPGSRLGSGLLVASTGMIMSKSSGVVTSPRVQG